MQSWHQPGVVGSLECMGVGLMFLILIHLFPHSLSLQKVQPSRLCDRSDAMV